MQKQGIKSALYILPYLALLMLGAWYRCNTPNLAILNGDSGHYLTPPFLKAITGEWHKGERPFQYLQFVYLTLSPGNGLKYTVVAQKLLGCCGACFLAAAWFVFAGRLRNYVFLWHLAGYLLLAVYVSDPDLMYYEQQIGPESFSLFVMCVLIWCLTAAILTRSDKRSAWLLSISIFINLYLINPMPKWIFAGLLLEVILICLLMRQTAIPQLKKILLLAFPHLLFFGLVYIPESVHKIDNPYEDRVYIEWEQMAYTHFDLLAQDPSNFALPQALEDSLIQYFKEARVNPFKLLGFNSDQLMWGKANSLIADYYKDNYDSVGKFYKRLDWLLVTKYPVELSRQIVRQMCAFYIPNTMVHKYLFANPPMALRYKETVAYARNFDNGISGIVQKRNYNVPENYLLGPRYPASAAEAHVYNYGTMPMLFGPYFLLFRWFDDLFLLALFLVPLLWQYGRRTPEFRLIAILYSLIITYVTTISIVHTFDVTRFIHTIYPFTIITTFMSLVFACDTGITILLNMAYKPE